MKQNMVTVLYWFEVLPERILNLYNKHSRHLVGEQSIWAQRYLYALWLRGKSFHQSFLEKKFYLIIALLRSVCSFMWSSLWFLTLLPNDCSLSEWRIHLCTRWMHPKNQKFCCISGFLKLWQVCFTIAPVCQRKKLDKKYWLDKWHGRHGISASVE